MYPAMTASSRSYVALPVAGLHQADVPHTTHTVTISSAREGCTAHSDAMADAHVVAACLAADVAVVVTTDPDDINRLAAVVPGVRILTRAP